MNKNREEGILLSYCSSGAFMIGSCKSPPPLQQTTVQLFYLQKDVGYKQPCLPSSGHLGNLEETRKVSASTRSRFILQSQSVLQPLLALAMRSPCPCPSVGVPTTAANGCSSMGLRLRLESVLSRLLCGEHGCWAAAPKLEGRKEGAMLATSSRKLMLSMPRTLSGSRKSCRCAIH